jgi:hypothetical protein
MVLGNKRADVLTKNDLRSLIDGQVAEGTDLDYKATLDWPLDPTSKEFRLKEEQRLEVLGA